MKFSRQKYVNKLLELQNNGRVKIITGITGSGKTYLLKNLFVEELLKQGVPIDHIIYLSLDKVEKKLLNPISLYNYLRKQLADTNKYYVILDEIHYIYSIVNPIFTNGKTIKTKNVDRDDTISFVNIIISLIQLSNVDLYVSGNSSKYLTKNTITEFRDRSDEIHIQPLTFSEIVINTNPDDLQHALDEYFLFGSLPQVVLYKNNIQKQDYLKKLVIYHINNVITTNKIKRTEETRILFKLLANGMGTLMNPTNIETSFNTMCHLNLTRNTIVKYLEYFKDCFLLDEIKTIDIKTKTSIGANYKYYFADSGLRNASLDFLHRDVSHVMENIIYNELRYRGYSIQVGMLEKFRKENNISKRDILETDFVARKGNEYVYIQAAYSMETEKQQDREKQSLISIPDSFKKIIITKDKMPIQKDEHGIIYVDIIDFLLGKII